MRFFLVIAVISFTIVSSNKALSQDESSGPNWNYIQGGLSLGMIDDTDGSLKGGGLEGSLKVSEMIFVQATGNFLNGTLMGIDAEMKGWSLGLGARVGVSDNTDVYGKVGYSSYKAGAKVPGVLAVSVADNGFDLGAGIRSMVSESVELGVGVSYYNFGNDNGVSFNASALYMISSQFAVGVFSDFGSDDRVISSGVRMSF
jgi:opacity protein-like surface antigen